MSTVIENRWPGNPSALSRRGREPCDYEAYCPDPLVGRKVLLNGDVAADVAAAEAAIARLDQAASALADTEALARLLLRAESVASSRIEGLEVGARKLLRVEAARMFGESLHDVTAEDVLGNIDAMNGAVRDMEPGGEITVPVLLAFHSRLLAGTRHAAYAGRLRDRQNWIGGSEYNPCTAAFVPPPPELVPDLLDDLCAFCSDDVLPPVAQAALAHAQFETIHPFADGNGRTGRGLIHLVLRRRGLSLRVLPPVSLVLATWAKEYVAGLTATRYRGPAVGPDAHAGMNRWIGTFAGACARAVEDVGFFESRVQEIENQWRATLGSVRRGSATDRLLSALPGAPLVTVPGVVDLIDRSYPQSNEAVSRLVDAGILSQVSIGKRNRAFEAREVINTFTDLERQLASPAGDTRISDPSRPVTPRRRSLLWVAGLRGGSDGGLMQTADQIEVIRTWLRRRMGDEPGTPRRLVYALPQHADPGPAATEVRTLLGDLGLTDDIALHVVMGTGGEGHGDWREDMHRPAIVIGTADVLASKVLLRGYDTGRVICPIDFALLTNGAHWVLPEIRLCPRTTATLTRLAQFAKLYGTAEPFTVTQIGPVPQKPTGALAPSDFLGLFDTEADVDITSCVCDGGELDAQVAWATWLPGEGGAPAPEIQPPPAEYRRRVPLSAVAELSRARPVWRRDQGEWVKLTEPGQPPARPYEVLLIHDAAGRELEMPSALASTEKRPWQSLDEHGEQVRDQAEALLAVLAPSLPPGAARSVVIAGYLHDVGKAHETWQDALCALADDEEREEVAAGRPWAKSGGRPGRLEFASGPGFRHEFASLLLIDGPLRHLLAEAPDPDLTRYLVLAHHGRLRLAVRDSDAPDDQTILGLEHGATTEVPAMLGGPATTLAVSLDPFAPDGDWTATTRSLLERYGPFTLAYLETVVRIADWRASGGRDLSTGARSN